MKLPETLKPANLFKKDKKGVALVTVLTVMALTTILVLTFFSLATSEHRASNTYSHGLQAQQVGEQAVNMVIAQIREATSLGDRFAWASQPGAIRTWSDSTGDNEGQAFKLYSDDEMKTADWTEFKKDFDEAKTWSRRPEAFVDLNEPVIRGEKVYYPVVHPLASTIPQWPKAIGDDTNGVEGFRYNDDGDDLEDVGPLGEKAAKIAKADGHVAMPVRWIYQLADGTLGVLSDTPSGGGPSGPGFGFVPISGSSKPTEKNPMVARFAFWADDETSKLNMNVHAGGLAWDIPKAGGDMDMDMGKHQPAQKEWQRYPGHPATTHLSPALAPGVLDVVRNKNAMEMLFGVVPRVVGGGSESGTRTINTRDPKEMNGLIADTEPLFPSLDDVIMRSDREPHRYPDATGRPVPADQLSEYLERAKFFVTVNSRAPETNMFNKPRVAIWPIYNAPESSTADSLYMTRLSAFDRLIHYCASMGKSNDSSYPRHDYIFKRENAESATFDYEKIERNSQLYKYLLGMMNRSIPGYGMSFAQKYGADNAQQTLTMLFDYIRTTNLHDDTLYGDDFADAFKHNNTSTFVTYTNPRDQSEPGFGHKGHGQVTPIKIDETKGMGRFFSLSGANIHVTCVGQPHGEQPALPLFPGVTQYRRGVVELPEGTLYTNLPPLPVGVTKEGDKGLWPVWLVGLQTLDPAEFEAAFDEAQWNWQLAFLDPAYRDAVLASPTATKFNRSKITKAGCELMRLQPGERLAQAAFFFSLFSPSIGWGSINPDMEVHVKAESNMDFNGKDGPVGFLGFEGKGALGGDTYIWATNWAKPHKQGGARSWGGLLSFGYTMSARQALQEGNNQRNPRNVWWQMAQKGDVLNGRVRSRLTPIDFGYDRLSAGVKAVTGRELGGNSPDDIAQAYRYDLVTIPFKVDANTTFTGGTVNFKLYSRGKYTEGTAKEGGSSYSAEDLVQDITMDFPPFTVPSAEMSGGWQGYINEFNGLSHDSHNSLELASLTADPGNPLSTNRSKATRRPGTGRSVQNPGRGNIGRMGFLAIHWDGGSTYVRGGDIVQSITIPHGDARISAAMPVIVPADEVFMAHRKYGTERMAHSLTNSVGGPIAGYNPGDRKNWEYHIIPDLPNSPGGPYRGVIPMPFGGANAGTWNGLKSKELQQYGDFDNGAGTMLDGPYINKPDEGNIHALKSRFTQEEVDRWEMMRNYGDFPYFSSPDLAESGGPAYFSPNRIVSGPGMFGSLPTAIGQTPPKPWQTLLFRPNTVGNGYVSHPGAENPPDHLLMDLFWMPVVEPYAISEPLSTAGKINMNYQIVPFLHIHRDTALRGVFRSEVMLCVPNEWHHSYKHDRGRGRNYHWRDRPNGGDLQGKRLRTAILEDKTLEQFKTRFDHGSSIFKSATEICEIHLVPEEYSKRMGFPSGGRNDIRSYTPELEQMQNGKYWRDHSLVGDNSRERPYTNIQTRLTTKSNTFLVHYRAQVIQQSRRENAADYAEWRPSIDTVQAEYRGSSIVERYVNPNDKDIPDFATSDELSIDEFYNYRVINPRRFAP